MNRRKYKYKMNEIIEPAKTVLYDGSKDLEPNAIFVTDRYWSREKTRKMYVAQVAIYEKFIVIYNVVEFHKEPPHRSTRIFIVQKNLHVKSHVYDLYGPKDDTPLQQTFMYDHFLFVLYMIGDRIKCCQYNTGATTEFVANYSKKEFILNALTLFIRSWRRLPFGSKRTFDPDLLDYPRVINTFTLPVPVRKYHEHFYDMIFCFIPDHQN